MAENPAGEGSPETQASPQATSPTPPPVVVYNPVPQPPPPPPTSNALKIILIVVAVFVVLAILAVGVVGYGVYKVRKAIHMNSSTGATTLSVPGMSMNTDPGMKFTPSELGTEIYPGAEPGKSGNMRMNIGGSAMVSATFLTSDPKEKVVDFYKSKLGSDSTSMDFGPSALLTLKKSGQDQVTVTISQEGNQSGGKTQIHIQHTMATQAK